MKISNQKTWLARLGQALFVSMLFVGCAGTARNCSSCNATSFGADWIVVQMGMDGTPYRCWELRDTSIANEEGSDGIYWLSQDGNLVHISGHYNRVQVVRGRWDEAFAELGLTAATCRAVHERPVRVDP